MMLPWKMDMTRVREQFWTCQIYCPQEDCEDEGGWIVLNPDLYLRNYRAGKQCISYGPLTTKQQYRKYY